VKILVINGPNLNLLGSREPEKYGSHTLSQINAVVTDFCCSEGVAVEFFQSNHEGEIIDSIHSAPAGFQGIIINPGALTHYSYSLRDAVAAVEIPVVEIHISNIFAREEFRHHSVVSPVAAGHVSGFGPNGYMIAVRGLLDMIRGGRQ